MKYRLPIVLLILTLASVFAFGQTETGSITGTVTDPTGAVVSGATITATNTATGAVRTATTSSSGSYTMSNLSPAPYEVAITAAGFVTFKRNVTVQVASLTEISARMSVAATGTTVEVTAGAGAVEVETQSSELSQMVSAQQVNSLPSLTRNPYDFVATAGNVTADQGFSRGAAGISINGQRAASTDILLDGAENVDLYTAGVGQQVPMDAVQEMRVSTSNFTAEYGRASGGVVNVATKSGTNGLHGSAYEFNRLSKMASNTYDNNANGIARQHFTRNQFGYSIGGPIIKNKLFFFNTTEWIRVRSTATNEAYVPNPGFLQLTDSATTQAYFSALGTLKTGAKVLSSLTAGSDQVGYCPVDPVTKQQVCGNPLVTTSTNVFDLVSYPFAADVGGGSPQNTYNDVARVDFNLSDKTQMFGRYAIYNDTYFPGYASYNAYSGFDTGEKDKNQNFLFSLSHLWTNNFISSTKLSFNRLNSFQGLGTAGTVPGLLIGLGGDGYTVNSQVFALPGYLPYAPGSAIPFGGPQNVAEIDQSISWNRGRHNFKFGGEYVYVRDNRVFGAYQEGIQYLTSGGASDGNTAGVIDGLLGGQLYRFSAAIDPQGEFPCYHDPTTNHIIQTSACTLQGPATSPNFSRSNRYKDAGLYFQDSWKMFPRFTFNYGVRWEYYGVQHAKHQPQDANFVLGSGSNIYQQITNGSVEQGSNLPNGGRLWKPRWKNFGPRVGFAWDVFGNGKTSVRGGYGIAFERNFGNVTFNVIQNPPNYAVLNIVNGRDVSTLPISTNNFGAAGQPGSYPFRSPTLRAVDTNIKPAYANVWNLSVEREVARNTVAALEYSGSRGIHGYTIGNVNDVGFGPAFTGDGCGPVGGAGCLRPSQNLNQQYSYMNYRTNGNDSWHDALNVKLSSSNLFKQGLNLNVNYTWAHTIDYSSATFGGSDEFSGQSLGTLDPFNPALDRGDADYDVRNRLALSAVWAPPYAQHTHGVAKEVLDGWEFSPIFSAQTGYPYTIFDCTGASSAYTCPRYIPSGAVAKTGSSSTGAANSLGGNNYAYETIPGPLLYTDPFGVNSSLPTCATDPGTGLSTGTNCAYPSNMTARNAFREPGYWNVNLGISKTFKVTERVNLQFRGELYNLFNHSNYYVQTGNLDTYGGLTDVAALYSPSAGTPYNYVSVTGALNGQPEYCTTVNAAGTCAGQTPTPYTIPGKKGVTNQAAGAGTGSLGERRFVQFALRLSF